MTVILSNCRNISDSENIPIGETTFLREYYENNKIVSWTHYGAHDYNFLRDGLNTSLDSAYVEFVLNKFGLDPSELSDITLKDEMSAITLFEGKRTDRGLDSYVEQALNKTVNRAIIRLKRRNSTIFQFTLYPDIKLLPMVSSTKTTLSIKGYSIIDVPADGNCAFTAVKVAQGDEKFKDKIVEKLTPNQSKAITDLRNATANKITDRPEFTYMLRQLGFWNNGVDGAVGIEVLSFVAQVIGQPILVITQEPNDNYRYWISGTAEIPRDGNLAFHDVKKENLEMFLNTYPDTIKLFHNGIHFQAIIKKTSLPELPPTPPTLTLSVKPGRSIIPATAPSITGTPPNPTEEKETIPTELERELAAAGYRLQDVPADGNCGVWVLLQALYPDQKFIKPTYFQKQNMQRLRLKAASHVPQHQPTHSQIAAGRRIAMSAFCANDLDHWLYTDDFRYFAQAIG